MKRAVLFIILLFAPAALAATDSGVETEPVPRRDTARPAPETKQDPGKQQKKDPQWPRPFVPREQIDADSVVTFPADI